MAPGSPSSDPAKQNIAHEKAIAINNAFEYLSKMLDAREPIVVPPFGTPRRMHQLKETTTSPLHRLVPLAPFRLHFTDRTRKVC